MRTSFLSLLSSALCPVKNKCWRICLRTAMVASSDSWYMPGKRFLDVAWCEAAGGPDAGDAVAAPRTFQRILPSHGPHPRGRIVDSTA